MTIYFKHRQNRGYTLVETLFYLLLFIVLALPVLNAIITMARAFRETTVQTELGEGGSIMERLSRETRKASNLTLLSASDLKLDTTDDAGVAKTVEFQLNGSNIRLLENNSLTGNLNTPNITVSSLTFTSITTPSGKAVKIYLVITSNNDKLARTAEFYDSIGLRGSY